MENIFYTCRDPNKTCFPRYHNMNRRLKDLQQRYADIQATLYGGAFVAESFGDVRFIILSQTYTKSNKTNGNSIEGALFPSGDKEKRFTVGRSLQEALKKMKTEVTLVVLMPSGLADCLQNNIIKNRDITFVIAVNDTKEHKQTTDLYKGFTNVKVSLFEDIKDTATVALEETIFSPMKNKTENLVRLLKLNGRQHTHAGEMKQRNKRKKRKEILAPGKFGRREFQRPRTEYVTRSQVQAEINKVFEEKINKHRDSIERLLGEILGLYNRSKVPEKDRPVINESLEQNVSDEVAAALYSIDASVKSCGYRFSTLQVFVDDTRNNEINDKIREVLRKNSITNCDIVPSIDTFKPLYKVGAKVHPNKLCYGTVGGFAKKNKKDLCALVSRHVAILSTDGNVCLSDGDREMQARIIPDTLPEQGQYDTILDIAAAKIRQRDNKKCDTRFKTEDGDLTTGKESDYDAKQLRNMHVHLWGATTSPGLGIITMPEIRDRDKDNTFIIVENRQNTNDTLCNGGDSGSIVCADDIDGEGVEVISMLIGEDIDHSGKYASFRIDKGLEQLEKQTNDDFHLCKD